MLLFFATTSAASEQLRDFISKLLITFLVIYIFPDIIGLVLRLSNESLVPLLGLNDIVAIVFVGFFCFGPIWVNLKCIGKPPRIVPTRL